MPLTANNRALSSMSIYVGQNKQQHYLALTNVVLLLGGLFLLFGGIGLQSYYQVDRIGRVLYSQSGAEFWSLEAMPWFLIGLGIMTFIYSTCGFIFNTTEIRGLLLGYSCFGILLVVGQATSLYIASELRSVIDSNNILIGGNFIESYQYYKADWDVLQRRLQCCGELEHLSYVSMRAILKQEFGENCYPKSCCYDEHVCNFNENQCQEASNGVLKKIPYIGCLKRAQYLYQEDLNPLAIVYMIIGMIILSADIISVALGFVIAAKIKRNEKNYQNGRI